MRVTTENIYFIDRVWVHTWKGRLPPGDGGDGLGKFSADLLIYGFELSSAF